METLATLTRPQWAWTLYNTGSFGFATSTLHTLLPVLFKQTATGALDTHEITAAWGYVVSVANCGTLITSPCIGSWADATAHRKLVVVVAGIMAILGVQGAVVFTHTSWIGMFICSTFIFAGYGIADTMCNAILPFVFEKEQLHTASCMSCSFSNIGAAITIGALLIVTGQNKDSNISSTEAQIAVWIATIWYVIYNVLFAMWVEEPPASLKDEASQEQTEQNVLARIGDTLSGEEMMPTRRFLFASFFLSEGAGIAYHMTPIYAVTVCHIGHDVMFWATLGNRVCGSLFAVVWAYTVKHFSARVCYMSVCGMLMVALFMLINLAEAWQVFVLQILLAFTGTGSFSLGRSLLATIVPPDKSAEVFGLNSFAGQISGMLGPFIFAGVSQVTGMPRIGFLVGGVFILLGLTVFASIPIDQFDQAGSPGETDPLVNKGAKGEGSKVEQPPPITMPPEVERLPPVTHILGGGPA